VLTLRILSGRAAGREIPAGRFPFSIGRSRESGLASDESGVWEQHARILLDSAEGFVVEAVGEAGLAVNGEGVRRSRLRNGDSLTLGALEIGCWLSPAPQRSLRFREGLTWGLILLLAAAQCYLLHRLILAG
jgi:pSer/pThr/pTyr-binding forkhead associated (FHA) protein